MESLADRIERRAQEAAELYHRLVLVVGPPGSGKTTALRAVRDRTGAPLVNASLELARRMLELTEQQRARRVPALLGDLVDEPPDPQSGNGDGSTPKQASASTPGADMVLLDNIEIVFDPTLRQDPLPLLLGPSRNTVVVATWPGSVADGRLTYAEPGHPEYRRYRVADFMTEPMVVDAEAVGEAGSVVAPQSLRKSPS